MKQSRSSPEAAQQTTPKENLSIFPPQPCPLSSNVMSSHLRRSRGRVSRGFYQSRYLHPVLNDDDEELHELEGVHDDDDEARLRVDVAPQIINVTTTR